MARCLVIRGRLSPDLVEMVHFIEEASERVMASDLQGDARIAALLKDYEALIALGPDAVMNTVYRTEGMLFEPTDALLAFVAKFRAVDHALFGAERQRRGWA
jgi:hypothetical protein